MPRRPRRRPAEAPADLERRAERLRCDVPADVLRGGDRRVHRGERRRDDQLRRRRFRQGPSGPRRPDRRLRRHRRRSSRRRTSPPTRAASSSTSRRWSRRSPSRYNLDGVDELQLTPGDDRRRSSSARSPTWNDPAIAADNPDVDLPDQDITVVHRSDSSGTTEQLHEVPRALRRPDARRDLDARLRLHRRVARSTQAGEGNSGVAQIVSSTDGCDRLRRPDAMPSTRS